MSTPNAVDLRYAQALLGLVEDGMVNAETLREELRTFATLLSESPELRLVLASPAVKPHAKQGLLDALVARTGASRITRNFLAVLVDRGRITALAGIQNAFEQLWRAHNDIVSAEVVSARPLAAEQRQALEARLAAASGKRIEASYREDDALIGGFFARVGDTVSDASLRGHLQRLRQALLAT